MQPGATTCTEDRIQHALERCLHGLSLSRRSTSWSAGLCLNCWSLQELVSRDPGHFLILLEQILQKTREVQEKGTYDLLTPLALLFYSTVLCTPHFPPDSDLLLKAASTYHRFLTWPVPYCSICQELLTFIDAELKAPGISYQRLVRAEQGLPIRSHRSSTVTVLLLNPVEVQAEFLAVANKLSTPGHSPHSAYTTLLLHAFQATFGAHCDVPGLHCRLQAKTLAELEDIFTETAEAQELASGIGDAAEARRWLRTKLQAVGEKAGFPGVLDTAKPGKLHTIPIPVARCYTYSWSQDSFDILQEILLKEQELLQPGILGDDEEEEEEEEEVEEDLETDGHCAERDSLLSTSSLASHDSTLSLASSQASGPALSRHLLTSFVSGLSDGMDSGYVEDSEESSSEWPWRRGSQERRGHRRPGQKFIRIYKLFKSTSQLVLRRDSRSLEGSSDTALPLRRAGSLCSPLDEPVSPPSRAQRSRSLPQPKLGTQLPSWLLAPASRPQRRRPFLSGDEDPKASTLRVVVFGSDRISGKVARAYSNLRRLENNRPLLTRFFKLQFFYVPVKRSHGTSPGACPPPRSQTPSPPTDSPRHASPGELGTTPWEESTNDISHYLGMLDPWYERNVLGLMHLPPEVLCQQSLKAEAQALEGSPTQLPILADMLLYYCRFAARPVLLQVYQTELTFITGEKTTEIFIHSLELGHSAATRAIKASGPGSKRLGIDGDREAVPLTLQIIYSKGAISGRSRWSNLEKVCTSVNLNKACRKQEELDSSMEALTLNLTEVVKRQNSKSKKGFNQISTSQIKVDKVQIIGSNSCPFAVCLDQDERKILQSVVRCEVSPCYKPEKSDLSSPPQTPPDLPAQAAPDLCSLLCLPIMTFSGALP
ncbi:phosphoinositide-3-kinase regulatory subunit 5 [Homo sapiens]|uniref:Phosphoinositide 3-kinase regulatory subunit 5 n=3 Tax=Homo sapiens TaxID=9606 RepID=PI3R5_HUMAN|nr:phosphoinositide 3-kinase regulatory subunit 5 isoform 1 [Homo sapiens]NP_055123.2 phosphoinositide 3-kinase regulatory subunit 5 isoform 1 [Homo sapiens]XP_047291665.1 phosphoinositide 3-kinase regulatory subunit 5 isoform X1 [Homo sapiens]XP_054171606.1 phosphoinositide 3-kinase regulatory subunit 5 isoform X1 [Homo sapiens]Q8WYR1.1 RecName: Full=Phosphoinositide 3-kinase regulatory subunit 5; Short=PI3-kinase regulatory subunit 5; AltName: Full=PI3-kinase p101 subunit; AltName: Full=Phosp|eukprot:NP_001136105.1 phosphoinositide 3-kinase regulatory subunit 5 isoform 1 [Homo sapiens]